MRSRQRLIIANEGVKNDSELKLSNLTQTLLIVVPASHLNKRQQRNKNKKSKIQLKIVVSFLIFFSFKLNCWNTRQIVIKK